MVTRGERARRRTLAAGDARLGCQATRVRAWRSSLGLVRWGKIHRHGRARLETGRLGLVYCLLTFFFLLFLGVYVWDVLNVFVYV